MIKNNRVNLPNLGEPPHPYAGEKDSDYSYMGARGTQRFTRFTHPTVVAIVCALCRIKLADVLPGSLARCPSCGTWSGTVERPRLPRRHSPNDQNRGVL